MSETRSAPPVSGLALPRSIALRVVATLVAASTAVAFGESYRALYLWASHHDVPVGWAAIWPAMVDVFVAVGELALLVGLVDKWEVRHRLWAWTVVVGGLAVSVAGNVGHVGSAQWTDRLTAAVPPVAAFVALTVGLGILKRVVALADTPADTRDTHDTRPDTHASSSDTRDTRDATQAGTRDDLPAGRATDANATTDAPTRDATPEIPAPRRTANARDPRATRTRQDNGESLADAIRRGIREVGTEAPKVVAWLEREGRPGVPASRVYDVLRRDSRPLPRVPLLHAVGDDAGAPASKAE